VDFFYCMFWYCRPFFNDKIVFEVGVILAAVKDGWQGSSQTTGAIVSSFRRLIRDAPSDM